MIQKRKFQKKQNILRNNQSGVAMIMVLIVGAVILVFCLSLLLVTYSLFAQTSRQTTRLQCKMMAQSFSESLKEELSDSSSDLAVYLGKQIRDGNWKSSMGGMDEEEPEDAENPDAVSELVLNLDDSSALSDYHLSVTLTYSLNAADDEESGGGDDEDDQDDTLSGNDADSGNQQNGKQNNQQNKGTQNESREGTDSENVVATYTVNALITCMRGDGNDRDTQYYVLETSYPAVSFKQ
ncbi:MAG: hypothetical protein PUE95_13655 [Lachnospiraceae bacterium]|nr:hypothetical protein [Lachnospiraceae bacterium]